MLKTHGQSELVQSVQSLKQSQVNYFENIRSNFLNSTSPFSHGAFTYKCTGLQYTVLFEKLYEHMKCWHVTLVQ